jgi:hypothetical protein
MVKGSKAHSKGNESSKEVRARRRTQKEVGLGNTLPLMVEDSKAHSKEVRARRRTQNEIGLGNALPLMVEGSKVHLKEVRVQRRTQKKMRA